jgi:hypothetical protein
MCETYHHHHVLHISAKLFYKKDPGGTELLTEQSNQSTLSMHNMQE